MDHVDVRAGFRNSLVKGEAPRALLWTGGVIGVLSVVNAFTGGSEVAFANTLHAGVVAVFFVGAWLAWRAQTPDSVVPWIVAACSVTLVVSIAMEVVVDPTALGLAYMLMGMLAFGPFTLSARATAVAALLMAAGFAFAAWAYGDAAEALAWCVAALAALLIGAVLLRVRLKAIDALGAVTRAQRELATRDTLTGLLNRRGVEERVPDLVAVARRRDDVVFAMFVDVDGLKSANDRFGHDFGDEVIRASAGALSSTMRASDLVGRWGGDEFIVVGMGNPLPPDMLADRLKGQLQESSIDLDRWPASVSIGTSTSAAGDVDFDALIAAADADMYARRRSRRES